MKKEDKKKKKTVETPETVNKEAPETAGTPPDEQPAEAAAQNEQAQADTGTDEEQPTGEQWAEALKQAVKERDSYKDGMLRAQAEFANFKRRNATVRTDAYDDGARETIFQTLPVIDNLERAIAHAESQGESGAMVEGVKNTLKQMLDVLAKLGLEEVPALGEVFDPEKHNAVQRAPGGEPDVICEVYQKGYKVKDKMIRYAMVKVSSGEEA